MKQLIPHVDFDKINAITDKRKMILYQEGMNIHGINGLTISVIRLNTTIYEIAVYNSKFEYVTHLFNNGSYDDNIISDLTCDQTIELINKILEHDKYNKA